MTPRSLVGLIAGVTLTLAACGGSDPESSADTSAASETTSVSITGDAVADTVADTMVAPAEPEVA